MSELLCVKDLTRVYGIGDNAINALDNVSFTVNKGEFIAIVGTSGSGKSTLLQLLGGLDHATSGEVRYGDFNILSFNDNKLSAFRRKHIGFIFQFFNLVPELTAYENIILPVLIDKRKPDKEKVLHLAEKLGLSSRLTHLPSQLSGGQQQRVAIARALYQQTDILLCDEPTGNLDKKTSNDILVLLSQIQKSSQQTIIMVTHDSSIAQRADRIIQIEDGKLVG